MFKKIILAAFLCPFMLSESHANWEEFLIHEEEGTTRTIRAVWKSDTTPGYFTLTSADPDSFPYYSETLHALPRPEGYPSAEKAAITFKAQNIDRQAGGNPFHLCKLSFRATDQDAESPLGLVQFGRMPTKGYPEGIESHHTAHHPIIEKWIFLGVTHKVNPEEGLADVNIERRDNRGLAMILPLFREATDEAQKRGAVEACYNFVCELRRRQNLLPIEGTLPHAAISLFHSEDPNIGRFAAHGFQVDGNEGFGWFYPKDGVPQPRVMVTRLVE